jgi:hypothetical protein
MAFNALRYSYFPREPDKFDVGPMIDRFRQGEADGNERRQRNALGRGGMLAAGGNMTGARNALLEEGMLNEGFGIEDRQIAAANRARAAKIDADNRAWQAKERERQQTLWGRQDQEWGQGQAADAEARRMKAAAIYASLYKKANGDPAKLKQLEEVARAGGFDIPAEFSQPGGGEVATAIAGGGQEGMTPYQQAQIAIEQEKMARKPGVELAPVDKRAILEADEMANAASAAIQSLDRALELHKNAVSGVMANEYSTVGSWLGDERSLNALELNKIITEQALQSLKAIFGSTPTEGERKILIDIQGSAEQPYEVREAILQRARAAADARLRFNRERSQQLRSGEYYDPARQGAGAVAPRTRAVNPQTGETIEFNPETGQWERAQ